jgi:hypothetical protein
MAAQVNSNAKTSAARRRGRRAKATIAQTIAATPVSAAISPSDHGSGCVMVKATRSQTEYAPLE